MKCLYEEGLIVSFEKSTDFAGGSGRKTKNGQRMKVVTMNSGTLLALVLKVLSNLSVF